MSAHCHQHNKPAVDSEYRQILWIVITINFIAFIIEMSFGFIGESQALKTDALDFLGDSLTYILSLWASKQSTNTRANVAYLKGLSLLIFALWVLVTTIYYFFNNNHPDPSIMSVVAFGALIANLVCVALLIKFRQGDANMQSVWLCTRDDAIGNILVIVAAIIIYFVNSPLPDLIVSLFLSCLFSHSAFRILRQARTEMV